MAAHPEERCAGMGNKSNKNKTLTVHYGNKDWFVWVCGLNGTGLIPGQTLTEAHISKEECKNAFGDKKSNNGYKTSKNPDFTDRTMWLWKRVHQVDKPVNNDVGLHFCQGLLYEHYHELGTVDWAEFAATTVNWYRTTKGVKKVHPSWAHAYPSITIDLVTGHPVDRVQHVCKSPSGATASKFHAPVPSELDEAKRRKIDNCALRSNASRDVKQKGNHRNKVEEKFNVSRDIKEKRTHCNTVEEEYVKNPPSFTPMAEPTPESPTAQIRNGRASSPEFLAPEISNEDIPNEDIPVPHSTPNVEIPGAQAGPQATPHSTENMGRRRANAGLAASKTASLINVLQLFRVDLERAVDVRMKNAEEEKSKLKCAMDICRHDVDIATTSVKKLAKDLDTAKLALQKSDTDKNRGEVIWCSTAIESGEAKLLSNKNKYEVLSRDWRLQVNLLTEISQAQNLLDTYFRLQDEEEKLLDMTGTE